jgi:trehalose-6-phosphate synthase
MERLKGIPLKLSAIELFAEQSDPVTLSQMVFAIIGISAEERLSDYRETQSDVNTIIHRINDKYPGLVYFEERKENAILLAERLQLFAASDILLVIPPRLENIDKIVYLSLLLKF